MEAYIVAAGVKAGPEAGEVMLGAGAGEEVCQGRGAAVAYLLVPDTSRGALRVRVPDQDHRTAHAAAAFHLTGWKREIV
jgi:hypothetical protein